MTAFDRTISSLDVDPHLFRTALRQLAGAVSVITAGSGDARAGLTATSVTSFSAEPPTILVSVNTSASAYPTIVARRHFAVNILAHEQQAVADRFAGRLGLKGADRYQGAEWRTLASGAPALVGALAVIDAEIEEIIERHSHAILIGRVKAVEANTETGALLYWRGAYERFLGSPQAGDGI
jgi:flavin reductase (DIM6/NTAB) family NADH-FMN oxidoreductase RutF